MSAKVILLSGGMDSAYLARSHAIEIAVCLFVDYGQPARDRELAAARSVCSGTGTPLIVMCVEGLALLTMRDGAGTPGPRVVPARNVLLCSLGANLAASLGHDRVVIGCTKDDEESYPDCRAEFIAQLSITMQSACGVSIEAPLVSRSKVDVLRDCRDSQLALWDSWSCYGPGPLPCGKCNSCLLRTASAIEAGVLDPLMGSRAR